jgi:Superinfection immunity protein
MALTISILLFYFLPTIIALCNHKHNSLAIATTNTLLGWTIIGWIVSLIWAVSKD